MTIGINQLDLTQPKQGGILKTGSGLGTTIGRASDKLAFLGRDGIGQRERIFLPIGQIHSAGAKAGATAGWVAGAAANLNQWTLPASQTASTLTVPIGALNVGDKIIGFGPIGQIESGGNAVTFDATLRSLAVAAADPTDTSLAALTQISVTGDAAMSYAAHGKKNIDVTVERNKTYYVLITSTTGASTDVALQGVYVLVQRNRAEEVYRTFTVRPKNGATAGWTANAAVNTHVNTMAASQTAGTLVYPLAGLPVGTVIKGVALLGQVESAGGAVSISAALYKMTPAAADNVATLLKDFPTLSLAADTALDATNAGITMLNSGQSYTVAAGEVYYVLITATTAASTDIQLLGIEALIAPPMNESRRLNSFNGKPGATAGWSALVASGGNDQWHYSLPASQTGSTLVIPVNGLNVGDTLTQFWPVGQIESAGGAVTVDVELRKLTAAAADLVDAAIAGITQIAVSADTEMGAAHAKSGLFDDVAGADETYYFLVTATTAAATGISLLGIAIVVEPAVDEALADLLTKFGLAAAA